MIKDFHPGDLWQNVKFLEIVQAHRNIKTFQCAKYSILSYMMGPLVLKTKVYISRDFAENDIAALIENLHELKSMQIDIYCMNGFQFDNYFKSINQRRRATYLIDLSASKDEIFNNISGKRRNQIRKGLREGVNISKEINSKIYDNWWDIYLATSERSGFTIQKKSLVWDTLQLPECRLFTAWQNEILLGGNIIFTHNFPYYWLGASAKKFSKLNAPSVLQWNIIQSYHKEGFNLYDLGGAEFDASHGPTLFKKSMGPVFIEYRKLEVLPNPKLYALIKFGAKIYYTYLKRSTW